VMWRTVSRRGSCEEVERQVGDSEMGCACYRFWLYSQWGKVEFLRSGRGRGRGRTGMFSPFVLGKRSLCCVCGGCSWSGLAFGWEENDFGFDARHRYGRIVAAAAAAAAVFPDPPLGKEMKLRSGRGAGRYRSF
jgi:hypothetical protein